MEVLLVVVVVAVVVVVVVVVAMVVVAVRVFFYLFCGFLGIFCVDRNVSGFHLKIGSFFPSFPICMLFISVSCLTRTSSTMLDK
jgi:hypothetical protein